MEGRTAISGLMPARPFRMLDKVLRLTPSDFAASVMVIFRGSKHSVLSTSPGCGGLCIFIVTLVVVLIVSRIDAHFNGPRERPTCPFWNHGAHGDSSRADSYRARWLKRSSGRGSGGESRN